MYTGNAQDLHIGITREVTYKRNRQHFVYKFSPFDHKMFAAGPLESQHRKYRFFAILIEVVIRQIFDCLIVWCLQPFSTVFQLYHGGQCTHPCFSGVLLTSAPHIILSKPLAAFPHNHCRINAQR